MLLSRIKLLISVVLIAGIAGGVFAFARSNDVDYYGTKADYYINPTREDVVTENAAGVYGTYSASVMDGIVRLLNSESFAEQLLLDGKTLPEKNTYGKDAKEKAELDASIDGAQAFVDAFNAAKTAYDTAVEEKTTAYRPFLLRFV